MTDPVEQGISGENQRTRGTVDQQMEKFNTVAVSEIPAIPMPRYIVSKLYFFQAVPALQSCQLCLLSQVGTDD